VTERTSTQIRLSTVAFFNATPLTFGLQDDPTVSIRYAVPSALLAHLEDRSADIALLPVIDYQRLPDAVVVPVGAIGCDGPTLTVRLFSAVPIEQTRVLAVDGDSHTSVVLSQVILYFRYGLRPHVVPLAEAPEDATRLLIGDKVITAAPAGLDRQLDLGQAWKELTGLPFVFAVWTTRQGTSLGDLRAKLERARAHGLRAVEQLVKREALPRGWPAEIARQYLTHYLRFDVGPRQLAAIERFHAMAGELNLIDVPPKPLRIYG
jgi:chorismate dehydratase